jgi:hypothetical protein
MALDRSNIAFIVSSSTLYTAPRERLLPSLCAQSPLVYTVINAYDTSQEDGLYMSDEDVSYICMRGGSWDFIGQIWASQLRHTVFEYAFFLQDTMMVEPWFVDYVVEYTDPDINVTAVHNGICNLMCCRMDYVRSRRESLQRMRNCTKKESIDHEGLLYTTAPRDKRALYDVERIPDLTPVYPYGSPTPRMTEYYTPIGITKYKANYGQTGEGSYYVQA